MSRTRRLVHAIGLLMACAGVAFVAWRLREAGSGLKAFVWTTSRIFTVSCLIVLSTAANVLLPLAWRQLLMERGSPVTKRWAIGTYGVSQLARYLPGNILHYASRQALGVAGGVPAWNLARVAVTELALVAMAGALTALLAAPLFFPALDFGVSVLLFMCLGLTVTACLSRFLAPLAAKAYLAYMLYVCWNAATFVLVLSMLVPVAGQILVVGGTYASAWLIGLITPGAPAGMGVRESVSIALLGRAIDQSALLLALLAVRVIGIVSDAITFFIAWMIRIRGESA